MLFNPETIYQSKHLEKRALPHTSISDFLQKQIPNPLSMWGQGQCGDTNTGHTLTGNRISEPQNSSPKTFLDINKSIVIS